MTNPISETRSPLVDAVYLLEKFPGKGGWTFARIPEILQDKTAPFGWVRVKGTIDRFPIEKYNLMPMGNGQLFLAVKAEIRKKIGKKEGDYVHVTLYADPLPQDIPEEVLLCLQDEPRAYKHFFSNTFKKQKEMIDWIYKAKSDELRIERIGEMISRVLMESKVK